MGNPTFFELFSSPHFEIDNRRREFHSKKIGSSFFRYCLGLCWSSTPLARSSDYGGEEMQCFVFGLDSLDILFHRFFVHLGFFTLHEQGMVIVGLDAGETMPGSFFF